MQTSDVVAVSSIVIAVLALAASVYQSVLVRQHNRQSVRPVLQLSSYCQPMSMTQPSTGMRLLPASFAIG